MIDRDALTHKCPMTLTPLVILSAVSYTGNTLTASINSTLLAKQSTASSASSATLGAERKPLLSRLDL